jgi:hypothetical protein
VTPPAPAHSRQGRLLEKLVAAVRPEFRVELFVPDPADPILGLKTCLAEGCDRSTYAVHSEHGLCSRHAERWRTAGRPELTLFATDPGPTLTGRSEPGRCNAPDCRYGVNARGLCQRHYQQWRRAGQPDPSSWLPGPLPEHERVPCALPFCTLWVEKDAGRYCKTHTTRWRQLGSPDHDDYVEHCLLRGRARVEFRGVPALLRLEFQYAMQSRRDEQTTSTPPYLIRWALRQARAAEVTCLLDVSAAAWRERTQGASWPTAQAFLIYAHDVVELLHDGTGWEVEYPATCGVCTRCPG